MARRLLTPALSRREREEEETVPLSRRERAGVRARGARLCLRSASNERWTPTQFGSCLKGIEIRKPLASNRSRVISVLQGQGGAAVDEDLSRSCCQNPDCPDHGQRGLGNLTACSRYGKHKHIRLLYCRTCRYRFSERKGTPLFGSQLPQD